MRSSKTQDPLPGDGLLTWVCFGGALLLGTGLVLQFGWPSLLIAAGGFATFASAKIWRDRHGH